jgi:hypothetical protein
MGQIAVCLSCWSLKILIVFHSSGTPIIHFTRPTSLGPGFLLLARLEWRRDLRLPLAGWPFITFGFEMGGQGKQTETTK